MAAAKYQVISAKIKPFNGERHEREVITVFCLGQGQVLDKRGVNRMRLDSGGNFIRKM
jgi:hypothetical protein